MTPTATAVTPPNRRRLAGPLLVLLAMSLLSACTGLQRPDAPSISSAAHDLAQLQHWQLRGKLGLRSEQHSASLSLNWTQTAGHFDIYLSGPLGQGGTRIKGDRQQVELQRAGEARQTAASPEALMYANLGWWLPVSELPYWVRGIASPLSPVEARSTNPDGSLAALTQNGWRIDYSAYQPVPPYRLPARLSIQRDEVRATLLIKHWQLQP